jgi:hypothetical protein
VNNVIVNLFVDIHPSQAKLTLFLDGNCFLIASMVSKSSLRQGLQIVLPYGSTSTLRNAYSDRHSSGFEIALQGMSAEINPSMR